MAKEKIRCWGPNCNEKIEAQYCCNDSYGACGCRGLPVDPPFCSEDCYSAFMSEEANKNLIPLKYK